MKPLHRNSFEHTPDFVNRRRALFPVDENTSGSDLDCIKSLSSDSDSDSDIKTYRRQSSIADYDIIGIVENQLSEKDITPQNIKPFQANNTLITPTTTIVETPTQQLKTPHDTTTSIPTTVPKRSRKSSIDHCPQTELFSPNDKENISTQSDHSKVRTALFPESTDMVLSPQNFYPKQDDNHSPRPILKRIIKNRRNQDKRKTLYLCNRRNKRSFSQINAGVRHGIRKPKRKKKRTDDLYLRAALNIIENSPLNDYLKDIDLNTNHTPLIEPAKDLIKPPQNEIQEELPSPSSSRSSSPEPDSTKKFFKSSKKKAIVTVNRNFKFEVTNGRLSLIENKKSQKRPLNTISTTNPKRMKVTLDTNDFQDYDDEDETDTNISDLINILDDKENDIAQNPDLLMSPTSQMCDMASGLAINSPKKRNLNGLLENCPPEDPKLYPVFYPGQTQVPVQNKSDSVCPTTTNSIKKFKPTSKDQMLLDAGQKKFGVTQCPDCQFIYHIGDPSDEIIHLNYHNSDHVLRFNGWKNERVVSNALLDGKILQIVQSDPKIWWKKVKELIQVVNTDLGFFDISTNLDHCQVFIYIKNKTIVGVLVAEVKTTAYKLLTSYLDKIDLCSEESYPIKCGVSRLWVSQNYRKQGIATALMEAMKKNFMFGHFLTNDEIAFSSPTEMGKIFGQQYFKTPNFLIYF